MRCRRCLCRRRIAIRRRLHPSSRVQESLPGCSRLPSQPMQSDPAHPSTTGIGPRRPTAAKKTSYLPLFIALGVLLVIAIAIILFFALRK